MSALQAGTYSLRHSGNQRKDPTYKGRPPVNEELTMLYRIDQDHET